MHGVGSGAMDQGNALAGHGALGAHEQIVAGIWTRIGFVPLHHDGAAQMRFDELRAYVAKLKLHAVPLVVRRKFRLGIQVARD